MPNGLSCSGSSLHISFMTKVLSIIIDRVIVKREVDGCSERRRSTMEMELSLDLPQESVACCHIFLAPFFFVDVMLSLLEILRSHSQMGTVTW